MDTLENYNPGDRFDWGKNGYYELGEDNHWHGYEHNGTPDKGPNKLEHNDQFIETQKGYLDCYSENSFIRRRACLSIIRRIWIDKRPKSAKMTA